MRCKQVQELDDAPVNIIVLSFRLQLGPCPSPEIKERYLSSPVNLLCALCEKCPRKLSKSGLKLDKPLQSIDAESVDSSERLCRCFVGVKEERGNPLVFPFVESADDI